MESISSSISARASSGKVSLSIARFPRASRVLYASAYEREKESGYWVRFSQEMSLQKEDGAVSTEKA